LLKIELKFILFCRTARVTRAAVLISIVFTFEWRKSRIPLLDVCSPKLETTWMTLNVSCAMDRMQMTAELMAQQSVGRQQVRILLLKNGQPEGQQRQAKTFFFGEDVEDF
jgi:hypothetical protein